jgi:hypothetical protein
MKVVIFSLLFFSSSFAHAFPEMIRHGYNNCITCHVSPTGGGVLKEYGHALSREVLSTWGVEGEEHFVGLYSPPPWLALGGDVRVLQRYSDTPTMREARFFWMQADLEAAGTLQKLTAVMTYGPQLGPPGTFPENTYVSRRHYLNYRPNDQLSVRTGRFMPAYGINTADHIIATKRGLGWDEGHETYNAEVAWLGSEWNVYGTGIFGRPDDWSLRRETGGALSTSYFFSERYKAGASYFYGTNSQNYRHVAGPYGILGISQHIFILAEIDGQWMQPQSGMNSTHGMVDYLRVDYEILQGLHIFATQEYSQTDLNNSQSRGDVYGLGTQFFPRPHFEIQLMWEKNRTFSVGDTFNDYAFAMVHVYL